MRSDFPEGLEKYAQSPAFTEETVPAKLTELHDTKPGVWGRLVVLEGALDYIVPGPPFASRRLEAGDIGVIEPTVPHKVAPIGAVTFLVEFHRRPR